MKNKSWPKLGCGVGLRAQHYPVITEKWPKVDWFEAISENYMDTGGRPLSILKKVREHYPIALHGTALSIGSTDPLNQKYLERLKKLIETIEPFIVSDHLCWSGVGGEQLHDLLPLPFTEEAICHVVRRVEQVQDFLKRSILLENVSTYVTYRHSTIPEWEFLAEVAKRSGCGILLDLNNIYVNAKNHNFDPQEYLAHIPGEQVGQFHLAGHTDMGDYLFDTHSASVVQPVWDLYCEALRRFGQISTLIEWDENIPALERLLEEAEKARVIYNRCAKRRVSLRGLRHEVWRRPKQSLTTSGDCFAPQNKFAGLAMTVEDTEEWMRARIHPNGGEAAAAVSKSLLNPQGRATGEERMSVYANGYTARIHEALCEVYPAIKNILGEETFCGLAQNYSEWHSSREYNLGLAGEHLPEFLQASPLLEEYPFLADLAKMEWLIAKAFHAFDEPPADLKHLATLTLDDWEKVQIIFQPSVSLISSCWPIFDLWKSCLRHSEEGRRPDEESEILRSACGLPQDDGAERSHRVLIGRKDFQVRCELIDDIQFKLLEGLLAGRTLGQVCEKLADAIGEEPLPLAQWFQNWVRDGLIQRSDIYTPSR